MATIRINAAQWNVLSGDQKAQVLAILQEHGSLQPGDTIVGDTAVEPIYSPADISGAFAGNRDDYENEAICRAGYTIAVAACQSIAPPGSTACIAVATVALNLCREAVGLRIPSPAH
ncbi:MAG: hypothetical protein QM758_05625 [Armatimonas sp.]